MKKLTREEFSERMVFYSLLGVLITLLIFRCVDFIKFQLFN